MVFFLVFFACLRGLQKLAVNLDKQYGLNSTDKNDKIVD